MYLKFCFSVFQGLLSEAYTLFSEAFSILQQVFHLPVGIQLFIDFLEYIF